jgi:hypothetical protein
MGPWSLYQNQQQTLLSFIRPLLFCSESHVRGNLFLMKVSSEEEQGTGVALHQGSPVTSTVLLISRFEGIAHPAPA